MDSFVYENCSRNVDTFTEFCSGYPTLTGEKIIYNQTSYESEEYVEYLIYS